MVQGRFLGIGGKDGTYCLLNRLTGDLVWQTNVVFGGLLGGFYGGAALGGTLGSGGGKPQAGLIFDTSGALYGTTFFGGLIPTAARKMVAAARAAAGQRQ